jgi:RHS repeat-associated protein
MVWVSFDNSMPLSVPSTFSEASYYRARYYDPSPGRFTAEDRIRFRGGDVNLYRYVWGSTPSLKDPFGLWGYGADFSAGFFGGWGSGTGGSFSSGVMSFRDTSNSCTTQGSYISGSAFVAGVPNRIAPFGNSQGNNPTHGLNAGVSGGIVITNANYVQELAGPFDNTTYALGPISINIAKGETGITVVSFSGGIGWGLGISHHITNTMVHEDQQKCPCQSEPGPK